MAQMLSGLYQKYGLEQTVAQAGGEVVTVGDYREIDIKLDLTTLGSAAAIITGTDNINIPAGFRMEEIIVINETAATGSGATLNLGLIRTDRSTEIDYDGFLAAAPRTDWASAGTIKTYSVGVTGAGALMGVTTGSNPGYLTADYDTAAFTAGVVTIRLRYRKV